MPEQATFNFYEVHQCGYYSHGESKPVFGNLAETLEDLQRWVQAEGKLLGETCTYHIEEGDEYYHTYCFDVHKSGDTGDYLLTTWNEMPSAEGGFASVGVNDPVGNARVHLSSVPANTIPGYATYFWFVPAQGILATVRLGNRLNGHQALVRYLGEFMDKFSRYVELDDDDVDSDHTVVGYRASPTDEPENYYPRFLTRLVQQPGKIDYIRKRRESIRAIIRKNQLTLTTREQITLFKRLVKSMGIGGAEPGDAPLRAKYEISLTPSEEELEDIISRWLENRQQSKWDDVGFKISGESSTWWLSHSLPKHVLELPVRRVNAEIVDGKSLLDAIQASRGTLLRLLRGGS